VCLRYLITQINADKMEREKVAFKNINLQDLSLLEFCVMCIGVYKCSSQQSCDVRRSLRGFLLGLHVLVLLEFFR